MTGMTGNDEMAVGLTWDELVGCDEALAQLAEHNRRMMDALLKEAKDCALTEEGREMITKLRIANGRIRETRAKLYEMRRG